MSINLMSAIFRTEFRDLQDGDGNTTKASTAKFVCIALADHANDEGEGAYPSIGKLSYKTSLTRTAIINALDSLKHNGIITANGTSKRSTVDYTVNPACFSQDSKPALLVNSVDMGSQLGIPLPVNSVDPNHSLTIHQPSNTLSSQDLAEVNQKVDFIIANSNPSAWQGRELLRDNLLPLADWYNNATGQVMTKRVQKAWYKALQDWHDEGVTPAHLQVAFEAQSKWRMVSDPNQLTKDAAAVKAAGMKPQETQEPKFKDGSGYV